MTDDGVVFINAIELPAERIEDFVGRWQLRAAHMRASPGCRDVRLHRAIASGSRFQLVVVAHWDSAEACAAAGADPAVRASMAEAEQFAAAYPGLYRDVTGPTGSSSGK